MLFRVIDTSRIDFPVDGFEVCSYHYHTPEEKGPFSAVGRKFYLRDDYRPAVHSGTFSIRSIEFTATHSGPLPRLCFHRQSMRLT